MSTVQTKSLAKLILNIFYCQLYRKSKIKKIEEDDHPFLQNRTNKIDFCWKNLQRIRNGIGNKNATFLLITYFMQ